MTKLKGISSKLMFLDNRYILKVNNLEPFEGVISGTAHGSFEMDIEYLADDVKLPPELAGKITADYIVSYKKLEENEEATKYTLKLVDMGYESGLGQVTYTFMSYTTNGIAYKVTLSLDKNFDTSFVLGELYSFSWSEDN